MNSKLIKAPVSSLITTPELKEYLRIESFQTDDNSYLESVAIAAEQGVETYLNRKLLTQTWGIYATGSSRMSSGLPIVELPFAPLGEIIKVELLKSSGVGSYENSVSETDYQLIQTSLFPELRMHIIWPYGYYVEAEFGYGGIATQVPRVLIEGVKMMAAEIYENKNSAITERIMTMLHPFRVDSL